MSITTILYVEDDDFSRDIMELLFDDLPDYELVMFADSQDFATRLEQLPDSLGIILLDIHVEPYDGFDMLKMIRDNDRFSSLPVLALTASVMNEEIAQLRTNGFDGAIAKPIDQDYFANHITDVLAGDTVWTV